MMRTTLSAPILSQSFYRLAYRLCREVGGDGAASDSNHEFGARRRTVWYGTQRANGAASIIIVTLSLRAVVVSLRVIFPCPLAFCSKSAKIAAKLLAAQQQATA